MESPQGVQAQLQCGICLEVIKEEVGLMDGCTHPFCFTCIYEWSKVTNLCPFCKKEFRNLKKKIIGTSTSSTSSAKSKTKKRPQAPKEKNFKIKPKKQRVHNEDEYPLMTIGDCIEINDED